MDPKANPANSADSVKSTSRVKNLFNKYFNYKAWADWDRSKSIYLYFVNIFKKLFIPQKVDKTKIKSFATVIAEMKLSENDLLLKAKSLKRLCFLMLFMAFLFYGYSMYQMLYGGILSVILSLVLMAVSLTLAFRYHFWYFQIKKRKLGCSIREWFKENFMGGRQ